MSDARTEATLPHAMTAVEISTPGGPEALRPASRPVPDPKPGELLVKVAAAGVNRPDVAQRMGHYPPPPGISDIPGLEIAGTIAAIAPGEGTERFRVGDAVLALVAGGGYAEYCVAPAPQALPVPAGLSMVEAAAIPETFFTVWHNVYERAALAPGETLLVHGGSSGIGTSAIQLAAALGSPVFATAGTAEKCAACTALGAKRAINYREEDFVEVVRAETDGRGVDVILDMVGGAYVTRDIAILAADGRHVSIATLGGPMAEIDMRLVMLKRLTITGSTLRIRPVAIKAKIAQGLEAKAWPLFENGALKPVIDSVFPLAEAAKAHARMDSGAHIGKIVLEA